MGSNSTDGWGSATTGARTTKLEPANSGARIRYPGTRRMKVEGTSATLTVGKNRQTFETQAGGRDA